LLGNFSNPCLPLCHNHRDKAPRSRRRSIVFRGPNMPLCRVQFYECTNQLEGEQYLRRKKDWDTGDERYGYCRAL
jgi:hypothetical protein